MEREAEQLMIENLSKNMSDADEYPAMMAMHARCISIIAHLWGVQKGETAIGSATTGSSEAIHLGGLAMKRRWQEKRMKDGKDTTKPNIIMGANAQVALEKFARYFEVEARILDVSEKVLPPQFYISCQRETFVMTSRIHLRDSYRLLRRVGFLQPKLTRDYRATSDSIQNWSSRMLTRTRSVSS